MAEDSLEEIKRDYKGERADLIPILQKVQEIDGYLSPATINQIARLLKISENEVYGVSTFYAQFRFTPPGKNHMKLCLGTACHVRGGEQMLDLVERRLKLKPGETTSDGEYDLERVACLGCCALAPVVVLNEDVHGRMSQAKFAELLEKLQQARSTPST